MTRYYIDVSFDYLSDADADRLREDITAMIANWPGTEGRAEVSVYESPHQDVKA